ncbi:MAG: substrate-binding domain-containing protein [Phycisphaerales bacterium]|nr:MAG: substrate-binding domain-containing protein [Phycisphaerales bacterium]
MSNSEKNRASKLAIGVIAAAVLFGCTAKEPDERDSGERELLLYCGAGIRPPVDELAEVFGREHNVRIVVDYAGSEVLLSKIKLTRRGDLYMPGDKHYVDQAAQENMILSQRPVCYFVPTILVQKGNPKEIHDLEDLLREGLKVGIGDAKTCAIGRKTKQIFAKNGIAAEQIERNAVFQSLTVNELGMQIQAKSLDAVIVWDAIARYYSDHGQEVVIPVGKNVISTVNLGVLAFTKNRPLADKFMEFATSEPGRALFKKHLYRVDHPE